jgi:hypothetical protein
VRREATASSAGNTTTYVPYDTIVTDVLSRPETFCLQYSWGKEAAAATRRLLQNIRRIHSTSIALPQQAGCPDLSVAGGTGPRTMGEGCHQNQNRRGCSFAPPQRAQTAS